MIIMFFLSIFLCVYREIAELHKSNATQDSRAQQAALSAEMTVREELKMAMDQQLQQHMREKEALIIQVNIYSFSLSGYAALDFRDKYIVFIS